MNLVRVWFTGYAHPFKMIDLLRSGPAPQGDIYGQLLRAALDSPLLYLPLALMGRIPIAFPFAVMFMRSPV